MIGMLKLKKNVFRKLFLSMASIIYKYIYILLISVESFHPTREL